MVFGARLAIAAVTATGLEPDPGSEAHDAVDPYPAVVPYSNSHLLTSPLLGLTVAFRVAVVWVIEEAVPVATAEAGT